MLCTNCGKEVPNDSEFCIYCGKRMEHEEDLERTIEVRDEEEEGPEEGGDIYCTNCGQKLTPSDRFCTVCGTPVSEGWGQGNQRPGAVENPADIASRAGGSGKKIAMIGIGAVAAVCVIGGVGFGVSRLLVSPKAKVAKSFGKTMESAMKSETGMNHFLGLDDMMKELSEGRTQQTMEFSMAGMAGFEMEVLSDGKENSSMFTLAPSVAGMRIDDIVLYQNEQKVYMGVPDALDDAVYLDLETAQDEYKGSFLDEWFEQYAGEDLGDYLPGADEEEELFPSYEEYCEEALKSLYDAMEVEKDGKRKIDIGGKSQNCAQYQVLIPGDALTDLFVASADYVDDVFAQGRMDDMAYGWNDMVRSFEAEDLEMTVCLDKKGRLAAAEGRLECGFDDDIESLEFNLELNGGDNPLDQMTLEFINDWGSEMVIERNKEFDKKNGIEDEIEISEGSSSILYRFSYDAGSGDWEIALDLDGEALQAEGEITDLDKGKSMTITLDSLSESGGQSVLEGTYQFTTMKDKIEAPFDLESAKSIFELDEGDFLDIFRDLGILGEAASAAEYF